MTETQASYNRLCPKCQAPMIISEWDGWVWMCFNCDYVGGDATEEEIKHYDFFYWYVSILTLDADSLKLISKSISITGMFSSLAA